jgi:glutamine synthetase
MDAFEQLRLIKEARAQDREDLQAIADANIGTTAATILAFNELRTADVFLNADPNTLVDVPVDEPVGAAVSGAPINRPS